MHALLRGDRDAFLSVVDRATLGDVQEALTWAAGARSWPCDPGGVDGRMGPRTRQALAAFHAAAGSRDAGDALDWAAMFDLYQAAVAAALRVAADDLRTRQAALSLHRAGSIGCAEAWGPQTARILGHAPAASERVDILAFATGDAPALACHEDGACAPKRCDLYRKGKYKLVAAGAAGEGVVRALLRGLHFDTDTAFILPTAMRGIRQLRRWLEPQPDVALLIVGHADTAGDVAHNQALSDERARAVAQYLRDDVDAWLAYYGAPKASKAWGPREDRHMLSALPGGDAPPFTTHPDPVKAFQAFSNASGAGLEEDGKAGPRTRRALIAAYMALDGNTLPAEVPVALHGCGELHPEQTTGDGVALQENRRVEIFVFRGPVDPPPRPACAAPGCSEYPAWRQRTVRTIDLSQKPGHLVVAVTNDVEGLLADAAVSISGVETRASKTDGFGFARFAELFPGRYEVVAEKDGFRPRKLEVLVGAGDAEPDVAPGAGGESTKLGVADAKAGKTPAVGDPPPVPANATVANAKLGKEKPPSTTACDVTLGLVKTLLGKPARELTVWEAAQVVAHLHQVGDIKLTKPPLFSGDCATLEFPGPSDNHGGRFVVDLAENAVTVHVDEEAPPKKDDGEKKDGEKKDGEKKKVTKKIFFLFQLREEKEIVKDGKKVKVGLPAWLFVHSPLRAVDVRNVVLLYRLAEALAKKQYGDGKEVRGILHIGVAGMGGVRNPREVEVVLKDQPTPPPKTPLTKKVILQRLNDCHRSGRAIDFGGVVVGPPGSDPITRWDWPTPKKPADPDVFLVREHWGSVGTFKLGTYRLQGDTAKTDVSGARARLFSDAMDAFCGQASLSKSAPAGTTKTFQEYVSATDGGRILYPDCQNKDSRPSHQDHIHAQIGPTNYEFPDDKKRIADLTAKPDPGAGEAPDATIADAAGFTRAKQHANLGGVEVAALGAPPNPAAEDPKAPKPPAPPPAPPPSPAP